MFLTQCICGYVGSHHNVLSILIHVVTSFFLLLLLEIIFFSWSVGDIWFWVAVEEHVWFCGTTTVGISIDVHSQCCHQRLQKYPASGLGHEGISVPEGHTVTMAIEIRVTCAVPVAMVMSRFELWPMTMSGSYCT